MSAAERTAALERLREGRRLATSGDLPAAAEAYRLALRADPDLGPAHLKLGVVLLRLGPEHLEEATASLRQAVARRPDSPRAHYHLGLALLRGGDRAAAIASFERALGCDPDHRNALLALAAQQERRGDHAAAARYRQRSAVAAPATRRRRPSRSLPVGRPRLTIRFRS